MWLRRMWPSLYLAAASFRHLVRHRTALIVLGLLTCAVYVLMRHTAPRGATTAAALASLSVLTRSVRPQLHQCGLWIQPKSSGLPGHLLV